MWWFTTRKTGFIAVNLKELLGLGSYRTAWTWLHKVRNCTIRQEREQLLEFVEANEIYIGNEHSGKRGRGAMYKCAVAVAIERKGKKLGRLRLQVIDPCYSDQLSPFIESNVMIGRKVETDGWKGYGDLKSLGYDHHPILMTKAVDKESILSGVHLVASLVK